MTTLADMALRVARLVTDVVTGAATAGTVTSLTDSNNLLQQNQYFDRGTLWITSGSNAGKVKVVTSHANNALNFATLAPSGAIAVGDRFAVARYAFPWEIIVGQIMAALDETFVETLYAPVTPITGDGETIEFTLPAGVSKLTRVEVEDPADETNTGPSTHWREDNGKLLFFHGYPPTDDWILHLYYRTRHPDLYAATDEISSQISDEWLRWKAAEYVLYWGVGTYGDAKEYRIEERLNRAVAKLKGLYPRKPIVRVTTAGG